jgi:hypothetical protein
MNQSEETGSAIEAMQNLLRVYEGILRTRNIDLFSRLATFAERESSSLETAKSDYSELCSKGCSPVILSAICWLLRNTSKIQEFISLVFETSRDRQRYAKTLDRAATVLEMFIAPTQAEHGQKDWFAGIDVSPPAKLAADLKTYVEVLHMPDRIVKHLEARSLPEFLTFLLTAYVMLATGRYRDRNVSAIISELHRVRGYDDVRHRMWRNRNYARLNEQLATPLALLKDFGVALVRHRNTF